MTATAREEAQMPLWRIRVALPDDPRSQEALRAAVAAYPAERVRVEPIDPAGADHTGNVVVELRDDGPLGDLLHSLHEISPHVFVSRVNPPEASGSQPATRVRQFQHRLGAYS